MNRNITPRIIRTLLMGFFLMVMGQRVFADDYYLTLDGYNVHVHVDNNHVADGSTNDIITITVTDPATGLPVNGLTLGFKIDKTSLTKNLITGDASQGFPAGVVQYEMASSDVGATPIDVTLTDLLGVTTSFPSSISLNFIPGPPVSSTPPGVSGTILTIVGDDVVADGAQEDSVKAYITDKNGHPVAANTPVYFTITGNGTSAGTASFSNGTHTITGYTDASGNVDIPITNTVPGTVEISASLTNGGPGINGSTKTVTFVTIPPDPKKSYIVVTQDNATADGAAQDIVTAYLFDAQGNPTTGTVTFTMPGGGTATLGTTSSSGNTVTAVFTDPNVEGVQVAGTLAGGQALPDQNNPANNYVTIHFVAGPPDPAKSYFVVTQDNATADGKALDIVTAYLYDNQGRPTTGTVNFAAGGSAAMQGSPSSSGNTVTADFVDNSVEGVQVTGTTGNGAILHDQNAPANNYVTIHFVAGPPDPAKSYIVVTQDNALANGAAQDIVTAYLFDAQGHPTAGTVSFTVGGAATMQGSPVSSGNTVTAVYVDNNVEGVQVTGTTNNGVVLPDQNAPANKYVTIHFVAGPPVSGNPGGGGSGGTPPGNGGVPPGNGNGGGTGGPGSNPGGGNGNNSGPGDNSGFTELFVRQDYRLGDGQQQDSVIAYITDAYKHPLKGVHVEFLIQSAPTSGTATATAQFTISPLDVVTDDQGMARIALTSSKPGTVFINAILLAQNVLIDGSYQIITFVNKPDVNNPQTMLSVVVYEALADGLQQTAVKAHVVDVDGEVMPGQYVTFKVDSGTADLAGGVDSVLTDANGDAIIYLTSKTVGYANVTATVQGLSIKNGSPARVKFAMTNIYVPKVFTPNNDGTNDVLKPILVGISTFRYFSVYNRWGNLIYTTEDPNRGWDGTFKGVAQPVETYLWIAEGVDTEGKRIVARGMTSLAR